MQWSTARFSGILSDASRRSLQEQTEPAWAGDIDAHARQPV
jgi:hypothetical protein